MIQRMACDNKHYPKLNVMTVFAQFVTLVHLQILIYFDPI